MMLRGGGGRQRESESSLLDFTLAGDLVSQQVVRVQIETNSAPLHSSPHTLRALAAPLLEGKFCSVFS